MKIFISWSPTLVTSWKYNCPCATDLLQKRTFPHYFKTTFHSEQKCSETCSPALCLKGQPLLPLSLSLKSSAKQTLRWLVEEEASLPLRSALWNLRGGKKTHTQAAAICRWDTALAEMTRWTVVCGRTLVFLVAHSSWKAWLMHISARAS